MSQFTRISRRGFTLVELLVVIGIIALLISMLLPALNKVRAQARVVQCMSNQRQVAMGVLMFANDHGGYAPGLSRYSGAFNWDGTRDGTGVAQWRSTGGADWSNGSPSRPDSAIPDSALVRLRYLKTRAAFDCPEMAGNPGFVQAYLVATGWTNGCSPHFNFNLRYFGETFINSSSRDSKLRDVVDYSNYWDADMNPGKRTALKHAKSGGSETVMLTEGLVAGNWQAWFIPDAPGGAAPFGLGAVRAIGFHNRKATTSTTVVTYIDGHSAPYTMRNVDQWGGGKVPSDSR